jgi:hypothetical protein
LAGVAGRRTLAGVAGLWQLLARVWQLLATSLARHWQPFGKVLATFGNLWPDCWLSGKLLGWWLFSRFFYIFGKISFGFFVGRFI